MICGRKSIRSGARFASFPRSCTRVHAAVQAAMLGLCFLGPALVRADAALAAAPTDRGAAHRSAAHRSANLALMNGEEITVGEYRQFVDRVRFSGYAPATSAEAQRLLVELLRSKVRESLGGDSGSKGRDAAAAGQDAVSEFAVEHALRSSEVEIDREVLRSLVRASELDSHDGLLPPGF